MSVSASPSGRAVFVGCARNCAQHLPKVLDNVFRMAELFEDAAFIFVENDSSDDTRQILNDIASACARFTVVSLEGLAGRVHQRTLRLETCRNRYLDLVRAKYRDFDYLFVVDCDEVNAAPIALDSVAQAVAFLAADPQAAGVFSNSAGFYYDMWALRHRTLCPGDIWEEVADHAVANDVPDGVAFEKAFAPRLFGLRPFQPPVEVDSAFNGLGIYKVAKVLKNRRRYVGSKPKTYGRFIQGAWQVCEHVAFNAGFRENGHTLYIAPFLINQEVSAFEFDPTVWRSMTFTPSAA